MIVLYITLGVIGLYLVLLLVRVILSLSVNHKIFGRMKLEDPTEYVDYRNFKDRLDREEIFFLSQDRKLQGYLYGKGNKEGLIIYCVGFSVTSEVYLSDVEYLVNKGYEVFTFDLSGTGNSEGKRLKGLSQALVDLDYCLNFIKNDPYFQGREYYLYGHSMGGYAVASVLKFGHRPKAVVSISGFYSVSKFMELGTEMMIGKAAALFRFPIYIANLIDYGKYSNINAAKVIEQTDIPVIVAHGTQDQVVNFEKLSILKQLERDNDTRIERIVLSHPGQDGHASVLTWKEGAEYLAKDLLRYEEIKKKYPKEQEKEARAEYLKDYDKVYVNHANEELMAKVLEFYKENT